MSGVVVPRALNDLGRTMGIEPADGFGRTLVGSEDARRTDVLVGNRKDFASPRDADMRCKHLGQLFVTGSAVKRIGGLAGAFQRYIFVPTALVTEKFLAHDDSFINDLMRGIASDGRK